MLPFVKLAVGIERRDGGSVFEVSLLDWESDHHASSVAVVSQIQVQFRQFLASGTTILEHLNASCF